MKSVIERRMDILTVVNQNDSVRVEELASMFDVSSVTIRNDLNFLEKTGYIVRSHGVAIPKKGMMAELSNSEKKLKNSDIKTKIGLEAAKLIINGDAIILDSGTTTKQIAETLSTRENENILVMTNGLDVAMQLVSAAGVEVMMTGGILRKNALSFSGKQAEETFKHFHFSKLFLGVDGLDLNVGITTHNEQEAILNRVMCKHANQIIAVTDSSKFGKQGCHVIRHFSEIDILITDSGISDEYLTTFQQKNIEVIIVD